MQIENLKKNMTLVKNEKVCVLVSYKTPVAYVDVKTGKTYRTNRKWSKTTTRHINQFLGEEELVFSVSQDILNQVFDRMEHVQETPKRS